MPCRLIRTCFNPAANESFLVNIQSATFIIYIYRVLSTIPLNYYINNVKMTTSLFTFTALEYTYPSVYIMKEDFEIKKKKTRINGPLRKRERKLRQISTKTATKKAPYVWNQACFSSVCFLTHLRLLGGQEIGPLPDHERLLPGPAHSGCGAHPDPL